MSDLSPAVLRYDRLYRVLEELCELGEGETEEAEALRAQLDLYWWALTRAEQEEWRLFRS